MQEAPLFEGEDVLEGSLPISSVSSLDRRAFKKGSGWTRSLFKFSSFSGIWSSFLKAAAVRACGLSLGLLFRSSETTLARKDASEVSSAFPCDPSVPLSETASGKEFDLTGIPPGGFPERGKPEPKGTLG